MKLFFNISVCVVSFAFGVTLYAFFGNIVRNFVVSQSASLSSTTVVEATTSPVQEVPVQKEQVQVATATRMVQQKIGIDFVGDVMLSRNVENIMHTYGTSYVFSNLTPHASTSYLVGNFESAIPAQHVHTPSMGFSFSVDPQLVGALTKYGFTHFGIANNHSYDFGLEGYENMKKVLSENNLVYFGDQRNQASSTIAYVSIEGGTVALIGIFAVDVPPTNEEILQLVTRAKQHSDIQIAFIHFGTEYETIHTPYQEKIAHELIDDGIAVVVGHHPHVVEDIELYKNRPIFYSLGNFLFDQYFSTDVQEGLTLSMTLSDHVIKIDLVPVTSIGSHSAPRFMGGVEKQDFLDVLAKKSPAELTKMISLGTIVVAR